LKIKVMGTTYGFLNAGEGYLKTPIPERFLQNAHYYELDKIHKNKISIENHLFNQTYKKDPDSYGFVNYDLTTSYFVGYKCNLSAFGKGKQEFNIVEIGLWILNTVEGLAFVFLKCYIFYIS